MIHDQGVPYEPWVESDAVRYGLLLCDVYIYRLVSLREVLTQRYLKLAADSVHPRNMSLAGKGEDVCS